MVTHKLKNYIVKKQIEIKPMAQSLGSIKNMMMQSVLHII